MNAHNPFPAAPAPLVPSKPFPLTDEQLALIEKNPAQAPAKLRDELLTEWQDVKAQLDRVKEREAKLRTLAVKALFPTEAADTSASGTKNFELGNGWNAKCVFKQNYVLPKADLCDPVLDAIEKVGPEGAFIVERLIKTSYEISVSEYKKLDVSVPAQAKIRELIDGILVVKPGLPEFKIEEPKGK
jgi:hypothetical protein